MKFWISLALFWLFNSCRPVGATGEISILASFYPIYIMARNITDGVPGVKLSNLTQPVTGCLHDYALSTNDMKKISGARVLLVNGAGMESFLDNVLRQFPSLTVIEASKGAELIKSGNGLNPHVWLSLDGASAEVANLAAGLASLDQEHADQYKTNAANYLAKLQTLKSRMVQELAPYKGSLIITFHEAFPYFARDFGLKIAAVVEREPGSTPGARELAATIALIRKYRIKALFIEPQYSPAAAQIISRETSLRAFTLDPAVTGPDGLDSYLQIMEKNLETLKEALGGS
ncbi:MAG: metal ABC transporter substrate-binding protein [Candidatus Wallbacteria bacterium]|nr:metal ABC transporter substrate-binding protein [Candidatus Wallbacteria bacterium]